MPGIRGPAGRRSAEPTVTAPRCCKSLRSLDELSSARGEDPTSSTWHLLCFRDAPKPCTGRPGIIRNTDGALHCAPVTRLALEAKMKQWVIAGALAGSLAFAGGAQAQQAAQSGTQPTAKPSTTAGQ